LSQKRVFWRREIQSQRAKLAFNRARNLQEFKAAVEQMEAAHNILYADATGNIAYFFAGKVPIRPENCTSGDPVARCLDSRLPLPGDGSAEWTGQYRAMPVSINPARGWLSNWNSKPALGYPNPDQRSFGKQYRSLEIDQRLAQPGLLSFDDMKDIAKDIARTGEGGDGREARYIKPFLLSALRSAPPTHPLTAEAVGILERWDGTLFDDAVSSQYLAPGQVIFSTWLRGRPEVAPCAAKSFPGVLCYVFGDEVPNFNPNNTSGLNMLIHVLDDALGGGSRVLPSRNYFDGCDSTVFGACRADVIMSTAFEKALDALGPEPAWSSHPRETTHFQHTLSQAIPEIASVLDANRASYGFVVVFERPKPIAESIVSLGQSGFIGLAAPGTPVFDVHFADQLELFRAFGYRPMRLFDNARSTK
jgi:penicillin amidase